ncbi:MAG: hypothetical protein WA701_13550 [Solirubrobacterales bacterium]|jgi:hypothetical protein
MSSIRKYTSPGLVLGVVAIVIALAGTSLAGDKTRTHPAGSVKQSIKTLPAVQQLSIPPQSTNEGKVEATVNCPSGYGQVVGGGATFASGTPLTVDARLIESGPNPQGHGWHVRYDNDQNTARSATVTALCLRGYLVKEGHYPQRKPQRK